MVSIASDKTLRLTEIFCSLQGESSWVGLPTVFVRLTGCPLRCVYCDTSYSFHGGESLPMDEVLSRIESYQTQHVCVTGGEPLAQKSCINLLKTLCDKGYKVSLETSGAMDIADVDARVKRIVDLKTPASNELEKNRYENIALLQRHDEVKFVICNRKDYDWAVSMIERYQLHSKVDNILFSPVFDVEGESEREQDFNEQCLADWILADKLAVRMQLQLHKLIWGNQPGR
ncbi:7-carboxy-7-deazaguanine synthase QueE [Pseudomonadales bacterium]|nr:7-carboxy-7-deazaguanine synthase QueE [Pseudomonadales bacterium]